MQSIAELIAGMAQRAKPGDGDFYDADGLLCCGKCGERREGIISHGILAGQTVRVMCACEADEKRREDDAARAREDQLRLERMTSASLMTGSMRSHTFAAWNGDPKNRKRCEVYADRFAEMEQANQGLLFYGAPGTGKTFASACIANALLAQGVTVLMTSFVRLLDGFDGINDTIDRMSKARLLIIDDLGAERDTGTALERVYNIVDSRYRTGKPMIMTTNLRFEDIKNSADVRLRRIYDRVMQGCCPMLFDTPSRRKNEAAQRFDAMQRLFAEAGA